MPRVRASWLLWNGLKAAAKLIVVTKSRPVVHGKAEPESRTTVESRTVVEAPRPMIFQPGMS